jgi:hypothetical protein
MPPILLPLVWPRLCMLPELPPLVLLMVFPLEPLLSAFYRDMYLDIPLIADAIAIHQHRAALVDERLRLANLKRISHDYAVGEQVLQKVFDPSKLEERHVGPYRIERVHVNGTLTIRKDPNVTERINIRRLKPFRS